MTDSQTTPAHQYEEDHPSIFLQPNCKGNGIDEDTGRLWCKDDPWGECGCEEGCNAKSVKYIREDLVHSVTTPIPPAPNEGRSYKELLDDVRSQVIGLYYLLPSDGEPYQRMGLAIKALNQLEYYHDKN